ncbi:MAG TPA: peptide chain release factor N(5)-glutamine methyltransferase [Saprospirales bacterium]|nr:peptide chain release factor N(5)-glutamine methyltransferase [Saprospirales bacterium]
MDRKTLQLTVLTRLSLHIDMDESARLARYLIEDLIPFDTAITEIVEAKIDKATERLIAGKPIQYVTHRADFYGYQYYVNKAVLIPRPETEELVYQVLQYLKKINNRISFDRNLDKRPIPAILDIGTGSGCIPVTIKKEYNECNIIAVDISNAALKVAIHNANHHGANVTFFKQDILSEKLTKPNEPYDIIISNPPYIPTSEIAVMSESTVKHEPQIALFTDDEFGLVFYQRIADLCSTWLADHGAVFLELNEYNSHKIKEIYINEGSLDSVEIIEDMQGKPRILFAVR